MLEVQKFFKQQFSYTPTYALRVPVAVELLGNHTDYNQGLVLTAAVDRYIFVAAAPRSDGRIELAYHGFTERDRFWLSNLKPSPATPWADGLKSVLELLRKRGVYFSGFNLAIYTNLPASSGLNIAAALLVATTLMVRELNPYHLTDTGVRLPPKRIHRGKLPILTNKEKLVFARLCHSAAQVAGVAGSFADYVGSLCSEAFQVVQLDCQHQTVELIPLIGDAMLVLAHSGIVVDPQDARLQNLRAQCALAAKTLKVKSLRAVDLAWLKVNHHRLDEPSYRCAYHIARENQRVIFAERALKAGDLPQFGQYLYHSHESSRDFFQNSCLELDTLVELAAAHPACLGARLTGAGFGGATLSHVPEPAVRDFMAHLSKRYEQCTGRRIQPLLCRIVDGAG